MDIILTITTGSIIFFCLIYIIVESKRRKCKAKYLEANHNIKVSITVYAITSILIVLFHFAYYLEAYPDASPFSMSLISLILLIFPLISYSLARKRIIVYEKKIIIYRIFRKTTVLFKDVTQIVNGAITTKIYSNGRIILSIDRRLYDNVRQFLKIIEENTA